MSEFVMREYQNEGLDRLFGFMADGHRDLGIYFCTGSGKTAVILAFLTRCMIHPPTNKKIPKLTHGVIITPLESIRDQFKIPKKVVKDRWGEYAAPVCSEKDWENKDKEKAQKPHLVIQTAEQGRGQQDLRAYLHPANKNTERVVFRTTQSMGRSLLTWLRNDEDRDLTGYCLFIDEAHHVRSEESSRGQATKLWDLVKYWRDHRGTVVRVTATPDLVDTLVFPSTLPSVTRTFVQQMADRFAPETILSRVIHVGGDAGENSEAAAIPEDIDSSTSRIVQDLETDRSLCQSPVKAFVRIQSSSREANQSLIRTMASTIMAHGFRVFVGIPAHATEMAEFNRPVSEAICRRRGKPYEDLTLEGVLNYEANINNFLDSEVDVILGITAIGEGIDWRICSHVYLHGVPKNLDTLIQMLGRAVRCRYLDTERDAQVRPIFNDYPAYWCNHTKITLVTAGDYQNVQSSHRRVVAMACAYLASFRSWSVYKILTQAFKGIPQGTDEAQIARQERVRDCVFNQLGGVSDIKATYIREHLMEAHSRLREVGIRVESLDRRAETNLLLCYLFRGLQPKGKVNKANIEPDQEDEGKLEWVEVREPGVADPFRYTREEIRKVLQENSPEVEKEAVSLTQAAATGSITIENLELALSQLDKARRDPKDVMLQYDILLNAATIQKVSESFHVDPVRLPGVPRNDVLSRMRRQ